MSPDLTWPSLLPPLLAEAGMAGVGIREISPLSGGVSSDIVAVTLADGRQFCAKRALPRLKVADDWRVPTERNHFEAAWFRRANAVAPRSAPAVLAEDRPRGVVLLEYLPPGRYALWKDELLAGRVAPGVGHAVADTIGRIHRATLSDPAVAAEFPTDALFDALRLDPYLRTTAERHPAVSARILSCLETVRTTRIALVHGDLSPKNILVSREDGHPVILDAECAWYGNPVFDAAFCLNHLLLKAIHMPPVAGPLGAEARDFFATWTGHFPDEMRGRLEGQTAALLACLMLARVDGKSPVEYLSAAGRETVRAVAIPLIASPPPTVAAVVDVVMRGAERT